MLSLLALILALVLAPAASARRDGGKTGDLVLFGKLENLDYQALDEFGLNGRMTARLRVTRVVRGHVSSPVLMIRYIAHTNLPEDSELRFHLRRDDDDTYMVCGDGGRGYICR
jgi:integration host factor subunit beta